MFIEAWGEAGWGVVDNALSRKISWYFVRRALAPRRLILRHSPDGKAARAVLFSEVADGAKYEVEVRSHKPGEAMRPVASFQGTAGEVRQQLCEIALDANGREATTGGFVVLRGRVDGQPLATVVLWPDGYLPLLGDAESNVRATVVKASQPDEFPCVRLESDGFAHGVHLAFADAPVHCSDNYFDLFSGESLTVRVLDRQADLSKIHVGWIGARGRMQGKPLVEADVLLGTAR